MIHFTADNHFGHENIIRYTNRPFDSVDHMNAEMVNRWNNVVGEDDTVYVVGDFALGKINDTLQFACQLNGTKILIVGNHDRPFIDDKPYTEAQLTKKLRRQTQAEERYIAAGFSEIRYGDLGVTYGNATLRANHFPFRNPESDDTRFQAMRPTDYGHPLIHGHVHNLWTTRRGPKGGLQINVGVDVWNFAPIPITEILDIINSSA